MRAMLLGLRGLPAAEVGLIRTIIRLSTTLHASWSISETGSCDVMLLGEMSDSVVADPGTALIAVRRRGEAPNGAPVLYRPIRAEELIELLNAQGERRTAGAGVAAQSSEQASAPTSTAPAKSAADAPVDLTAQPIGARVARLRRWPPHAMLGGKPARIQLATYLSRQALSPSKLSAVASRPLAECEAFMRELDAGGLLNWQHTGGLPPTATSTITAVSGSALNTPLHRGLLHRLRSKLGISRLSQ